MKTLRLNPSDIDVVSALLHRGDLVAFPTDTVYGLGVRYDLPKAIDKLIQVKQRPESKPFPMMVSSDSMIEELAELSDRDRKLIQMWMPGDITFIFKKHTYLDTGYFKEATSIAFRMPKDEFILSIISSIGVGLLVPSANISGDPAPHTSDEVLRTLEGLIEAVVIGKSGQHQASTIIDASNEVLTIVRQGRIQLSDVLDSLKEIL